MLFGPRGPIIGLGIGVLTSISAVCAAQSIFTYSATDYHTVVMSGAGTTTIPVRTIVIIQTGAGFVRPQVATRTFDFMFRPPDVAGPHLIQAVVDHQIVDVDVVRSNIDGEMEATVQIPVAAGSSPELKMDWSTKDAGTIEITLKPTPASEHVRTQRLSRPMIPKPLYSGSPALAKKTRAA